MAHSLTIKKDNLAISNRKWTRDEYHRAAEAGILKPGERLELIDGEIITKVSPIGSSHSTTVYKLIHKLEKVLGAGYYVHSDSPVTLSDISEPEPDICVAKGSVDDYEDHHPTPEETMLIIEVSDSSLAFDRSKKALIYANAEIPEYWIINLKSRIVEVYFDPMAGSGYQNVSEYSEDDLLAPHFAPDASIIIKEILPRISS